MPKDAITVMPTQVPRSQLCDHIGCGTAHRDDFHGRLNGSLVFRACGSLGFPYHWLVGNGRMVVIVVIIVPHSSMPY